MTNIDGIEKQIADMTLREFVEMTTAWKYNPEMSFRLMHLVCRPKTETLTVRCVPTATTPMQSKRKILAIKEFRTFTGLPLRDSKDWVDGNTTLTFDTRDEIEKLNDILSSNDTGYEAVTV